jgi:hypothetical protein
MLNYDVDRYYLFLVFNVFLLTTFAGGLLEDLQAVIDAPTELPTILARTLPSQSNFFLSYILVNGVSSWYIFLLTIGPLVKTRLLKQPYDPPLPRIYDFVAPKLLLVLTLAINFATVAPLLLLPAAFSFFTIYVAFKYLFIFVYVPVFESGGRSWPLYASCIFFALAISLCMLIGLFGLKEGPGQATSVLPLLFVIYKRYSDLHGRYETAAKFLPLLECQAVGFAGEAADAGAAPVAASVAPCFDWDFPMRRLFLSCRRNIEGAPPMQPLNQPR